MKKLLERTKVFSGVGTSSIGDRQTPSVGRIVVVPERKDGVLAFCIYCGTDEFLEAARSTLYVRILKRFGVKVYQCVLCRAKYFDR